MKRNSATTRCLMSIALVFSAPAWAQDEVAPTAEEQAALELAGADPRFQAMAAERAELERLLGDPEVERATDAWSVSAAQTFRQHLRSVAARGDAQSLLAAAMLWPMYAATDGTSDLPAAPSAETRAWFDAARQARPRDPLVAWIEATDCGGLSDTCDPHRAVRFLLQADPGNAAVRLLASARAEMDGDAQAADQDWASAAAADSYQPRVLETGQLLYAAIRDVQLPSLGDRLAPLLGRSLGLDRDATPGDMRDVGAMSVWAAVAMPSFQPITRRCKAESLAGLAAEAQAQCEQIMAMLARDESMLLGPLIGLAQMAKLTAGSAEGSEWRERLRQFQWIYENSMPRLAGLRPTRNGIPPDYLRWVMTEGELVAMRRLLESNGVAPQPPVGWLPENPRYRSLVATGREPQD